MDEHSDQTNKPGNPVPPTIRLTSAAGKSNAAQVPKIRIQQPPTSLTSEENPVNLKKETARVNLPPVADRRPDTVTLPPITLTASDEDAPAQDVAPKAIRIKRPGTAALHPPTIEAKKETARVDIQEALAETEKTPQQPKTIRLKRPGTAVIEQAQQTRPESTAAFQIEEAKKSETSRIELPAEASVEVPRRRKTVQIKRSSSSGPATRIMSTGKTGSFTAPAEETFITIKADDEATPVFSLVTLAAAIVTCVLLYVLAAQTVLPSLPWPGKL